MAEEKESASVFDTVVESIIGGITSLLEEPEHDEKYKKTLSYKIGTYFSVEEWVKAAGGIGVSRGLFITSVFTALIVVAHYLMPDYGRLLWSWFIIGFPVVGPIAGIGGFWFTWMWYINSHYIFVQTNPILLEVKMPTEITKSPRAMEQVLTAMWTRAGTTTKIDRNWHGGVLPYYSLELCSFGGDVRFYIWMRKRYKNTVEAAMYSQYPEVEIVEVEDYAVKFEYDPAKYFAFVTDYVYAYRSDVYPIKTYVDFELDKDPKEELKVEPYGTVIEALSSLNQHEQAWIQIVIRGNFADKYQKEVGHEVDKIRDNASQGISLQAEDDPKKKLQFPRPTPGQSDQMRTLERHMHKLVFDVGMRGIYISPVGKQRGPEYTSIRWIWRPFNSPQFLNGLRPKFAHNDFDYLWQDWKGVRWNLWARRYFDMYRRRQFFHTPWNINKDADIMQMTTETLATLWHPPSRTVTAPGLRRIPVSKAEAPPNLPM